MQCTLSGRAFAARKAKTLASIRRRPPSFDQARRLLFLTRHLDLDEAFSASLWDLLRDQAQQRVEAGVAPDWEPRVLEITFQLTPPVVPSDDAKAYECAPGLTIACQEFAS